VTPPFRSRRHDPADRARGGFTLIELAVVLLVLGILSGLALPRLRQAIVQADAAHVVSDVAAIRNASFRHLTSEGRFPGPSGWGAMPSELSDHLSEDYGFSYKGMRYRWLGLSLPFGPEDRRHLGILMIDMRRHPLIAAEMRDQAGPFVLWSPALMYFIYWA